MMGAGGISTASPSTVTLGIFPSEFPSIEETIEYLDANEPLVQTTYGFELRGELPPALISLSKQHDLTGFNLLSGAEAATTAGMKHNLTVKQMQQENASKREAFGAMVLERKNALAQAIKLSLHKTAPLRLLKLQKKGPCNTVGRHECI